MLNTVKFFSRYTNYILFDYKKMEELHEIYSKEIKKTLDFLGYLEKFFKPKKIYEYYFQSYFTKHAEFYFDYLDLTGFLEFAVTDIEEFKADITHELRVYF